MLNNYLGKNFRHKIRSSFVRKIISSYVVKHTKDEVEESQGQGKKSMVFLGITLLVVQHLPRLNQEQDQNQAYYLPML